MGVEEGKTQRKGGWTTFEEHCQEVMTQFVTAAIKQEHGNRGGRKDRGWWEGWRCRSRP